MVKQIVAIDFEENSAEVVLPSFNDLNNQPLYPDGKWKKKEWPTS